MGSILSPLDIVAFVSLSVYVVYWQLQASWGFNIEDCTWVGCKAVGIWAHLRAQTGQSI